MKIYTKGGDRGTTGIHGGERVPKDDIRIEANGTLDELNATIGVVRAYLQPDDPLQEILFRIQKEMMVVMSHVATPAAIRERNPNALADDLVSFCENTIDNLTAQMSASSYFILPGGTVVSAHLHMARTLARRAERRLWTLHKQDEVTEKILIFINRLSDLFFTMARFEMQRHGTTEERWKHFLYKRKSHQRDKTKEE